MLKLLPTDTCYGLSWDFTETDYRNIYSLKWRDFSKPLAFLVEDFADMKKYIEITDEQIEFLRSYQYPWSFIGKKRWDCILPGFLDPEKYTTISLRIAKKCIDANIRNKITFPIFLTSANLSGKGESTTLNQAKSLFPWILGIDGGICDRPPSDIFSLSPEGGIVYLRKNYWHIHK